MRAALFYGPANALAQQIESIVVSQQISDFAELRAYNGDREIVYVTGYRANQSPSGIAGLFVRDDNDTTTADDNGNVIRGARCWKRAGDDLGNIKNFGAENGVQSASAFQAVANICENQKMRYVHVPGFSDNYKLGASIKFNSPGVRIFGEQGATYNRGTGKNGFIECAAAASPAFDLGNSRTTGNPADNWEVQGISFRQQAGVPVRTVDGISFTSRTNGPDRGAVIKSVSFIGLRDAITTENPDLETQLANLIVENCVFTGCESAINAKGNLLGLRFVGNQCEQNAGTNGVIRGSINGGVTITDNMLEGQPNAVSIDIPPTTGNRPQVEFSRNYLEANSGQYVLRYRTGAKSALTVGPNYATNILASDYVLLDGNGVISGGDIFMMMNDPFPIVFSESSHAIAYGSRIFCGTNKTYGFRKGTAGRTPEVILSDFMALTDSDAAHVHALAPAGTSEMTPFGIKPVLKGGGFLSIPLAVAVGDLVVLNILCRAKETVAGNVVTQIYNAGITAVVAERGGSAAGAQLNGRWALISMPFIAQVASASLNFRFYTAAGNYDFAMAGIAAKNYGAFANDGTTKAMIAPVIPNVV